MKNEIIWQKLAISTVAYAVLDPLNATTLEPILVWGAVPLISRPFPSAQNVTEPETSLSTTLEEKPLNDITE